MPIGITTEHEELRQAVRRFVETRITPAVMRAALDAAHEEEPPFWAALREPGWLGLHIADANGGAGFGLVEQAVVIEELGRAAAPGPYVPTVVAAAVLDAAGGPAALLAHLASGERTGAVALTGAQPVVGGGRADVIVCEVEGAWYALDADAVTRTPLQSVDPTRPVVARRAGPRRRRPPTRDHDRARAADRGRALRGRSHRRRAVVRRHCRRVRQGPRAVRPSDRSVPGREAPLRRDARPHRACARRGVGCRPRGHRYRQRRRRLDRRGSRARIRRGVRERQGLRADAGRDRLHLGARRSRLPAARDVVAAAHRCARRVAHPCRARGDDAAPAAGSRPTCRRKPKRCAPSSAHSSRRCEELDAAEQRARLVAEGYITPSWPRPWGRDAGALELLDDRGGVPRREGRASRDHGRRLGAAEPHRPRHRGAASPLDPPDAARRDPVVPAVQRTGRRLRSGLALDARDARRRRVGAQRAEGVDVGREGSRLGDLPGPHRSRQAQARRDLVLHGRHDVRRVSTFGPCANSPGQALFNEVFFDDVFVPDDCLVGQENDGWRCARTTLANERVFMGASNTMGAGVLGVLNAINARGLADDRLALLDAGDLVVTGSRVGRARLPPDPAGAGRRRPVGFGSGSAQVARRPARPARARGRDDVVWCRRRGE